MSDSDFYAEPSGSGDGDAYAVRGKAKTKYKSRRNRYANDASKAVFRLYECPDFDSEDDTFEGGRLMLGGGYQNEWENEQPFKGRMKNGIVRCKSVQVYKNSEMVFTNTDFAGTPEIYCEGKATFINCKNRPKFTSNSTGSMTVDGQTVGAGK